MKRIILFTLLLCGLLSAQVIYHTSKLVWLKGTETDIIYLPYPPERGGITSSHWSGADTTALTGASGSAKLDVYSTSGDVFVQIVTDTVANAGTTMQESDSLSIYMVPYTFSELKNAWYGSSNDTTYLVFDTRATYTKTSKDYLDWTHGLAYTCPLSGETWANSGIQLIFEQAAADVATAETYVYVDIYIVVDKEY